MKKERSHLKNYLNTMESIKQLNEKVSSEVKNELDLFLTNTCLDKKDQAKLIEIINKIVA